MASRFDNIQSRSIYVGASPNPDPALGNLGIDGSLGVGTTTPSYRIHVQTTSGVADLIGATNGTQNLTLGVNNSSGGSFLFENSSNALRFGTSGSERMRITSVGYVGIGTTNPIVPLDVNGTIRASAYSVITNVGTDQGFSADDGYGSTIFSLTRKSGNEIRFQGFGDITFFNFGNTGTEKMRITTGGNVGIGTTSPGAKLHVSAGDSSYALFGPNVAYGGSLRVGAGPATPSNTVAQVIASDGNLHLDSGTGQLTYINYYSETNTLINPNAGNVGIGSYNPIHKLTVGGNISISGGTGYLDFANGDIRFVNSGGLLSVQTYSVGTGLSTKMVVTGAGNVGIGTTAPDFNLTINGITGIQSSGTTKYHFAYYTGGLNFAQTGIADYRLFIKDGGYVGIGTGNPQARLDVNGGDGTPAGNQFAAVIKGADSGNRTLYFDGATQASVWWGSGNTPQFAIDSISGGGANFWTNNGTDWSERMRIQVNGDIAINTTVASYKLDVNGWFGALRIYPYNTNSTYFAGDTGGITVNGPGYLYAASSGGSYFEGNVRIRGALSNDTAGYLQINGGTANLTYFAGTIGVGSTSIFHSASITSAGKIFLAQTNNSDIGGTIYGYWDTGYQAYAGGLVFQSFNANGGTPYTMKDVMWLTGNGNLGVGTNNTFGNKVAINRGVSGTPAWNNATLELRAESSLTAALVFHRTGQSEASIYSDNGSLVFGEFGGERMRITGGNVGIGTSSPGAKLEVSGLIKTNRIQLTDGASNGYVLTSDASGNGTWQASVQPFTGNAIPTKPLSGGGYMTYLYNTTTSTTSTANILYLTPFIPINTIRSSSIFIQVVTPSAGSTAKIVVYSDSNGSPSSLLIESPLLDCSTSGFKVYALNYNFIAGTTYWVSVVFSSSTVSVTGNSSLQIIAVRTNSNAAWNSFSYTLPSYPTIPATLSLGTGNFSNPASVPRITIVAA